MTRAVPLAPTYWGENRGAQSWGPAGAHGEWWGPGQPSLGSERPPSPAGHQPDHGHTVPPADGLLQKPGHGPPPIKPAHGGHNAAGPLRPLVVGSHCPDRTVQPVGPRGAAHDLLQWLWAQCPRALSTRSPEGLLTPGFGTTAKAFLRLTGAERQQLPGQLLTVSSVQHLGVLAYLPQGREEPARSSGREEAPPLAWMDAPALPSLSSPGLLTPQSQSRQ